MKANQMKTIDEIKNVTLHIDVLDGVLGGKIDLWMVTPNPSIKGMTPVEVHEEYGQEAFNHFVTSTITGHPA